jgi:ATP-dependent helicase/nuclease subunit A
LICTKTNIEMSASSLSEVFEPHHSVVVEACAGSGKTWLLASRIVRLLLAGVAPGAILAITFTRKAAREIEERVIGWLRQLATGGEAEVAAFLAERGVSMDEGTLRAARGLYERVLAAHPGLTVKTFHAWFLRLVDAAPLSANLAGSRLAEFESRLFDELWQSFAAERARQRDSEATRAFVELLETAGSEAACRMLRRAYARRSEWLMIGAVAGKEGTALARHVVDLLRGQLGVDDAPADFFAGERMADSLEYLRWIEENGALNERRKAESLRELVKSGRLDEAYEALRPMLLTREGTVRKKGGQPGFVGLHERLGQHMRVCLERQSALRILDFNRSAGMVFAAFLAHAEIHKRARRQIDFADAEWQVLRLLRDPETAAFVQARLDARYRHVLLDEFQDTNPLQWQILRAWFNAYSDAERPSVFLVGDPKQSVYRFRRAEPRLFSAAADYLCRDFSALHRRQDHTRRNARAIVEVVNTLFSNLPEFTPFRAHTSLTGFPGRVELLPLQTRAAPPPMPERRGLRNPLAEPEAEAEDQRRSDEASALAEKIGQIVGRGGAAWQIDAGGDGGMKRAARYGDLLLLVRSRTHLACYEHALAAAGIPFEAGSRGGLLEAPEVSDLVALLEFLVTPADDLKLAQVLRSPLFSCGDDELAALALAAASAGAADADESAGSPSWWSRITALAETGSASVRLARAARLLGEWLRVAGRLPVHDLLDRIYHQGRTLARYRLATPPVAAPAVEANLRALLLLSLDLSGGRYPSLPRFLDTLRELRRADASDAPDGGHIETDEEEAQPDGADRVRILTIHGAKGLEAPIVWLLGANESPRSGDPWDVLVDWPPEEDAPRHFSFYGRKEERGAARADLFAAEAAAARREELNLLYVAITRARQVFIASGSESGRGGHTPYRLLKSALEKLGNPDAHGDSLPIAAIGERPAPAREAAGAMVALPAVGERRTEARDDERFGILLHALLEHRTQDGGAVAWRKVPGFGEDELRRALSIAERLLAADHLRLFFSPERYRRAWNEVEFADGTGRLLRIDRLVEFDDELWVLDYKSSGSDTARIGDYRAQLAGYCRAVAGAFKGRPVRGALLFGDATLVEVAPTTSNGYPGMD